MRVVVDTGSPLFGLFVNSGSISDFEKGVANVPHRRPPPLEHSAKRTQQQLSPGAFEKNKSVAMGRIGGSSANDVRGSARKNMNSLV